MYLIEFHSQLKPQTLYRGLYHGLYPGLYPGVFQRAEIAWCRHWPALPVTPFR